MQRAQHTSVLHYMYISYHLLTVFKIDLIDHFKMVMDHCTTDIDKDYTGQQRFCPMRKNVCF